MKLLDSALYLLAPALVLMHLAVAPYTKVEESFNMQAVHDVLAYGTPTGAGAGARLAARYDHFVFPGAVPRTFVGAVLLAGIGQPVVMAMDAVAGMVAASGGSSSSSSIIIISAFAFAFASADGGMAAQLVVRGILGLANAAALVVLARSLGAACGRGPARWYLLLQLSQFHVLFYASRTLPNMFAFFLTTLAFSFLLTRQGITRARAMGARGASGRLRVAVCLLVLAAAVFRAEVALLLAAVAAYLVAVPLASAQQLVRAGSVAVATALLLSVPLDTYFWQRPPFFWPELHGFVFNVVRGQASAWGVAPWHYYFSSALPRLLLNPLALLLLVPLALVRPASRGPARLLVLPCLAFVALYSLQPHKEARFILYVVPPLTAAAALGADQLVKVAAGKTYENDEKDEKSGKSGDSGKTEKKANKTSPTTAAARALLVAVALSIPLSFAASTAMLLVSALNYPGGEALAALRGIVRAQPVAASDPAAASASVVTAHADVLACMTGVTLFGSSLGPVLSYGPAAATASDGTVQLVVDKTEDMLQLMDPVFWDRFDYVLAEPQNSAEKGAQDGDDQSPIYHFEADQWEPVAVVNAFAGIEVLRPGQRGPDDEQGQTASPPVVGHGAAVAQLRRFIRGLAGGWWVGPRMEPRLQILKRIRRPTKRVELV